MNELIEPREASTEDVLETAYLCGIEGMEESILQGLKAANSEFVSTIDWSIKESE